MKFGKMEQSGGSQENGDIKKAQNLYLEYISEFAMANGNRMTELENKIKGIVSGLNESDLLKLRGYFQSIPESEKPQSLGLPSDWPFDESGE